MGYGAGMGSYVPPAYGGAYGGVGQAYLDENVVNTQKADAINALTNQHKLQTDMLNHQFEAQKNILQAECTRNCTMAEQQFQQQMLQQQMALEQQFKEQQMQLDMAKQQREMMITQQAAQMLAQAQQHKMQIEMQKKMASLYGNTAAAGVAGAAK